MGKKFIINLPEDTQWVQWRCKSIRYGWTDVNFGAIEDLTPYTEPDLAQVRKYAYKIGYEKGYRDGVNRIGDAEDKIRKEAYEKGFDAGRMLNTGKYEKGINDAWGAARTLWNTVKRKEIFGYTVFNTALMALTGQEAIEKIRQYEQEQEEIKVGDEVLAPFGTAVVTNIVDDRIFFCYADGHGGFDFKKDKPYKTGRHFPEIVTVLAKMRENT